ncbi:MAG: hypothetical protein GC187_03975 [Alphaproteobacteria bacterium]|nr:hypothetical protein [Alphaproteobacteria bacterium]
MRSPFLLICAIALTGACSADTEYQVPEGAGLVEGTVDQAFTDRVWELVEENKDLIIRSQGGLNSRSIILGEILSRLSVGLSFQDYCLSACASYLIATRADTVLERNLLLGFHGDSLMHRAIFESLNTDDNLAHCYQRLADRQAALYAASGLSTGFSQEMARRLGVVGAHLVDREDWPCPEVVYEFENDWWFPTSQQIEDLLNKPLTEPLCADDLACMRRKLRNLRQTGRIVIGDDVYWLDNGRLAERLD